MILTFRIIWSPCQQTHCFRYSNKEKDYKTHLAVDFFCVRMSNHPTLVTIKNEKKIMLADKPMYFIIVHLHQPLYKRTLRLYYVFWSTIITKNHITPHTYNFAVKRIVFSTQRDYSGLTEKSIQPQSPIKAKQLRLVQSASKNIFYDGFYDVFLDNKVIFTTKRIIFSVPFP